MTYSNVSSIVITQTLISRWYSQNSMNCIAPNTSRRAMNWKSGCADRNSRGEHLHGGILRGGRFAQAAKSAHANCSQICDKQKSNRQPLPLLFSSLPTSKLTKAALMKRFAILDDARLLRPDPALLTRIDFLSAQVQYLARQF